jgi:hypothetical protein
MGDEFDNANDAAYEDMEMADCDDPAMPCPKQSKLQRLKKAVTDFRRKVRGKLKSLFTKDEQDNLGMMKDNVGIFPLFNAHGWAVDTIFWKADKELGMDDKPAE